MFHEDILKNKVIKQINDLIYKFKQDPECEVYFYSASIDPVVHAIAEFYCIPYKSSMLSYHNGLSAGVLSLDLLGNKDLYLCNKHVKYVITDNKSDLNLIYKSEKSFIITSMKDCVFWNKKKRKVDNLIIL
jgi:hypothetical protein